jgi:hypothetical protein
VDKLRKYDDELIEKFNDYNIKMFLFHNTDMNGLLGILKDGKLLPASIVKHNNQNPYEFFSPYVYFNAIPNNKNNFSQMYPIGIVFDSSILLNKIFYTNITHSAGDVSTSKKYKFNDINNINIVLRTLYTRSYKIYKNISKKNKLTYGVISTFQEIFSKIKPNIKDAKYIIINSKDYKKIKDIVKNKYPNIIIINV